MSLPEVLLWQELRNGALYGLRFRRQHPVGPFILDFYCAEANLAVEIDGQSHDSAQQTLLDERRTAWLTEQGISTLRIAARDILARGGLESAMETIAAACPSTMLRMVPLPSFAGEDQ